MRAMFRRVFSSQGSRAAWAAGHTAVSSELTSGDVESYYLRLISDALRRMLVPGDTVEVGVQRSGTSPSGLIAFAGYVRILKWDPVVTPVVLQNISVIDARIRKMVSASVILEGTHFSGLWFQATRDTQDSPSALLGLPCQLIHVAGGAAA